MNSSRHHYIPEFLIKGFTDSSGKLHVYDKIECKFKKRMFSPKQIFFEWNTNNVIIDGVEDSFIEKQFGQLENLISTSYISIIKQTGVIEFDAKNIFDLLILASLTHWRLPLNENKAKEYISNTSNKESFIKIIDRETGHEVAEDIYQRFMAKKEFILLYKLMRPIIDFISLNIKEEFKNWRIYSAGSDVQLHVLGDNPIVLREEPEENILKTQLVFPLSKGITLYHYQGNQLDIIPPTFRVKVDMMIFIQSHRYVAGPNREYLEKLVKITEGYNNQSRIEHLRNDIFGIFE